MSQTTEDLNKRTRKLEAQKMEKGEELVQQQQYQNQIQAINSERMKNLAIERQDAMAQGQTLETMSMAGAMATQPSGGGTGVQQLAPQTQATLGKYGLVGQPKVQRQSHRDVQVKPNNITINNTYNTTTTNNVSGGGPTQGRPVQISAASTTEARSQGRFKTWMENVFTQQKEQNTKRVREYEKREWSLSKSVNKMLRKMEDSTRSVAKALDPRGIGTTVASQLKTLFWLFGIHFLAQNWDKIMNIGSKVYKGITGLTSFFGLGEEGRKRRADGTDFRGTLIEFLTGDKRKAKDGKTSLFSVFTDIFKAFGKHIQTWFEKQMALRGAAIKAIKFPDLKLENNSSSWGLDAMFGRLVSALGSTLGKVMSGVTTYLGDILTAIVNPEAGASRAVDRSIEQQSNFNSNAARHREGLNMYKGVGNNTMRGDYALEATNSQGKKSYALTDNALGADGKLTGTAASTISQGRDILGAYNDVKEYGAIDLSRVYQGIRRLQETAQTKGSVVLDKEFVDRMFGSTNASHAGLEKVRMKYVRVENDADMQNRQHQYMMEETGWGTAADVVGYGVGGAELAGTMIGTGGLGALKVGAGIAKATAAGGRVGGGMAAGMTLAKAKQVGGVGRSLKALGKGFLGEKIGNAAVGWAADAFGADDYHLELVPENDPRPAASVDGVRTGVREYYRAKPEIIDHLLSTFDPNNTGDRELILSNMEKHMVQKAGGQAYVDNRWRLKGQDSGYFAQQRVLDVSNELGKFQELRNIRQKYDNLLSNDEWSQYKNIITNNAKEFANNAAHWAGGVLQGAGQMLGITGPSTRITKAEAKKNAVYIMNDLIKRGLQPHQAAGIVGNLMAESGLNPSSNAPDTNGLHAGGLASWNGPLWERLHKFAAQQGKNWNNIDLQLDYLWSLLNDNSPQMKDVRERLARAKTPYDASDAWAYYEKYAGYNYNPNTARQAGWSMARIQQEHDKRGANANGVMDLWNEANGSEGGVLSYIGTSYPGGGYSGKVGNVSADFTSGTVTTSGGGGGASISFGYTSTTALGSATPVSSTGKSYNSTVVSVGGGESISFVEGSDQTSGNSGRIALCGDSWGVGMSSYWGKNDTFAVSGWTVSQVSTKVSEARSKGYDNIVVYCGLNSCGDNEAKLTAAFEQCVRNASGAKVFLCTIIQVKTPELMPKVPKVNGVIRGVAARMKCGLIDLERSSGNYQQFLADPNGSNRDATFHLTSNGYKELVKEIKSILSGGNYVPQIQQEEVSSSFDPNLVNNGDFYVPNSGYSATSGMGNDYQEFADNLAYGNIFSDVKPDSQILLENQEMQLMANASKIWDLYGPEMQRYYSSFNDFLADYSGLSADQKTSKFKQAQKFAEGLSLWEQLSEDNRKKHFENISDVREFALRYSGLNDEDQADLRDYVTKILGDQSVRENFDFDAWKKGHSQFDLNNDAKAREVILRLMEGDEAGADELEGRRVTGRMTSLYQSQYGIHSDDVEKISPEEYAKLKTYIRHRDMADYLSDELKQAQSAQKSAQDKYKMYKTAFEALDGSWTKGMGGGSYKTSGWSDNTQVYQARTDGAMGSNPAMRALYDAAIEMGWDPERDGDTVRDIKRVLGGTLAFQSYMHDYERELNAANAQVAHIQNKQDTIGNLDDQRGERTAQNSAVYDKMTRELDEINNRKKDIEFEIRRRNEIINGGAASMQEQDRALREKLELEKELTELSQGLVDKLAESDTALKKQREKADKAAKALGTNIKAVENLYFSMLSSGRSHHDALLELQKQYGDDVVGYLQQFDEKARSWVYKAKEDLQNFINNMRRDWAHSFDFGDEEGMYKFLAANGFNQYNSTTQERDMFLWNNTVSEWDPVQNKMVTRRKYSYEYDNLGDYMKASGQGMYSSGVRLGYGSKKNRLLNVEGLVDLDLNKPVFKNPLGSFDDMREMKERYLGTGTSTGTEDKSTIGSGTTAGLKTSSISLGVKLPSLATGGWTPDGSAMTPYAGILHSDEYVIPKFMTQIPSVRSYINGLEAYRTSNIAGQKVGQGKVKEPTDYTEMMVAHQAATNELLKIMVKANSAGFNKVTKATLATIQPATPPPPQTRTFNYS